MLIHFISFYIRRDYRHILLSIFSFELTNK